MPALLRDGSIRVPQYSEGRAHKRQEGVYGALHLPDLRLHADLGLAELPLRAVSLLGMYVIRRQSGGRPDAQTIDHVCALFIDNRVAQDYRSSLSIE